MGIINGYTGNTIQSESVLDVKHNTSLCCGTLLDEISRTTMITDIRNEIEKRGGKKYIYTFIEEIEVYTYEPSWGKIVLHTNYYDLANVYDMVTIEDRSDTVNLGDLGIPPAARYEDTPLYMRYSTDEFRSTCKGLSHISLMGLRSFGYREYSSIHRLWRGSSEPTLAEKIRFDDLLRLTARDLA